MLSAAYSAGLAGIDGFPVTVECNVRDKLEGFELVGLPTPLCAKPRSGSGMPA